MSDNRRKKKGNQFEVQTDPEIATQLEAHKEKVTQGAHKAIYEEFPKKILSLQKIIDEQSEICKDFHALHAKTLVVLQNAREELLKKETENEGEKSGKKRKLEGESVSSLKTSTTIPCNEVLRKIFDQVKKEVLEMLENINNIKVWIRLNIPKIEDRNNFGVAVQEEVINLLTKAEEGGVAMMETITNYHVNRARLSIKMLKNPGLEDIQQSILLLDEKEFVSLRVWSLEMRNEQSILYDSILKNMDKLVSPKSANHMSSMM